MHLPTNIDIADISELQKYESNFINDLLKNKLETPFDFISMKVAKEKPKTLPKGRILFFKRIKKFFSRRRSKKKKKSKKPVKPST